ncbi:hypothetical protein jhhlp_007270 [Lomentospora prolificans]|uniref:Translation machinery-associated protein 22 n=1 Tax=Lomentospora prolificans TaxID=41688 RepID=A0A2N3N285_9PEZI|nr:hypothetical protein jhhlp_007270 [Lomentospora prolificans]
MTEDDQHDVSLDPGREVIYCGGRSCHLSGPETTDWTNLALPRLGFTSPYCEYGGTVKKCQQWLEETHSEMYQKIWSAEALEAATASLSVDAQKRAAKDAQKKAAKAEAALQKQADKLAKSVITIKRIERNKKKFVTAVSGLEAFGLDLKKIAKEFGKKFATGSSVTKTPSGGEEIVVQGDVSPEIEELLLEHYKDIPPDNIELVDDKKKKKPGG